MSRWLVRYDFWAEIIRALLNLNGPQDRSSLKFSHTDLPLLILIILYISKLGMPPTPGIFPVPYGTTTSHSHNVPVPVPSSAVISSSSSAQVIGPGVPGPVAGFHLPPGPPNVKLSRLDMAGQGLAQEVYGPGIGHGLHPHSHLHGHGHTGHLQSHQLGHGHHGMGGSGLRHGEFFYFVSLRVLGGQRVSPVGCFYLCNIIHDRGSNLG